ncbi:MAG: hypothetical protein D6160_15615 [Ketobacter sp.]|nr:MAG: hypothetical protein D6160_15615 [Ketobacter sp.]
MEMKNRLRTLLLALALTSVSSACLAENALRNEHFHFSGFATLGLTKSGNEDLGFHRDQISVPVYDGDWSFAADSMVGLQFDFNANEKFGGGVQLVGKDRTVDSFENSVGWAFLRYRINPDWTVRAGRLRFDLFMLSEYLDVGFAYLWARPPSEFYTLGTFDSYDGADLTWSTLVGEGTLRTKIFAGSSKTNASSQGNIVDIELNDIIGTTITWESEHWQLRFSASDNKLGEKGDYFLGTEPLAGYLQLLTPLWPEATSIIDRLYVSDPHIRYYALGAAYFNNPWQIQTELSFFDSEVDLYSSQLNGYLSVGYRINDFTPYVMVASAQSQDDRVLVPDAPVFDTNPVLTGQLAAIQQASQTAYDGVRVDQKSLTAGVRWALGYNLALKMQWDHAWIGANSAALWDVRTLPAQDEEINTFSINLNCIF